MTTQPAADFWHGKTVIVTGGAGFLGCAVVAALRGRGVAEAQIVVPRRAQYDLRRWEAIQALLAETCATQAADPSQVLLIHLAGNVGGIGYNLERPGELLYDNLIMGTQLIEAARQWAIDKCVIVGTVCAYPKVTPVPFREEDLWNGYPEESNAPYGLAKKMLLVQAQAYRQQYGLNAIYLLPVNLYGPGDNVDPTSSHVIPALIRRFVEARTTGQPEVTLWGDGSATREFLYVADAAEGILLAAEHYNEAEPVNLGSGQEIAIRELATLLARLTGYEGRIVWDTARPNGQPRRCLETSRAERLFGFRAQTSFAEGLAETVRWYEQG
ncbi:GDP-L-fucose synthase [Candidatus Chloroploca sp. M-50]|uniref:GDP-L-fucose synthase n=1 Tax=Candidatus Chloroploca mongolica TaxID=2528176 RepID=A0ABS4D498_9CHLR|nr:GDP-L-fucose synthase [Candidatus Chloroploca mongolica]MBP1464250.1 GDP-L-fucose synthase [Candidatus Chloroploca mongolica]